MAQPKMVITKEAIRDEWKELTRYNPVFFGTGMRIIGRRSPAWYKRFTALKVQLRKRSKLKNEWITLHSDGEVTFEPIVHPLGRGK